MKIIGIYTPVGRCLQTTFSFALGQILSKKAKVLYMNFERYSGLEALLKRSFQYDISDLVYYFQCAKEKLSLRLSSIVENIHGLDFVPPVQLYQSILGVHGQQWIELFAEIEKCSDYEYLILDLTDGVADLWDILRSCTHVYTITRGDGVSLAKMDQYERGLRTMEYEDVLAKTRKIEFPVFKEIPIRFDELTYGDLARYVKQYIISDEEAKENLRLTKIRDKIKSDYCKKNKIPLLRIKYTDFNKIENILNRELKKYGIT